MLNSLVYVFNALAQIGINMFALNGQRTCSSPTRSEEPSNHVRTRELVLGENGQQPTDLTIRQAIDLLKSSRAH
jgi:hypothetical protein